MSNRYARKTANHGLKLVCHPDMCTQHGKHWQGDHQNDEQWQLKYKNGGHDITVDETVCPSNGKPPPPPSQAKYLQRICRIWVRLLHLCIHKNHHPSHSIHCHIGHSYMLQNNNIPTFYNKRLRSMQVLEKKEIFVTCKFWVENMWFFLCKIMNFQFSFRMAFLIWIFGRKKVSI